MPLGIGLGLHRIWNETCDVSIWGKLFVPGGPENAVQQPSEVPATTTQQPAQAEQETKALQQEKEAQKEQAIAAPQQKAEPMAQAEQQANALAQAEQQAHMQQEAKAQAEQQQANASQLSAEHGGRAAAEEAEAKARQQEAVARAQAEQEANARQQEAHARAQAEQEANARQQEAVARAQAEQEANARQQEAVARAQAEQEANARQQEAVARTQAEQEANARQQEASTPSPASREALMEQFKQLKAIHSQLQAELQATETPTQVVNSLPAGFCKAELNNSPGPASPSQWSQDAQPRRLFDSPPPTPKILPTPSAPKATNPPQLLSTTQSQLVAAHAANPSPISAMAAPSIAAAKSAPQTALQILPKASLTSLSSAPTPKQPAPKQSCMPAAAKSKGPAPSDAAIHRRLSRAMEPNAKGVFKVTDAIRKQWEAGGDQRNHVIRLFAESGYETDRWACCFAVHLGSCMHV